MTSHDNQIAAEMQSLTRDELAQVQGGRPMGEMAHNLSRIEHSAIVFVGGYGAASYQYANETMYDDPA